MKTERAIMETSKNIVDTSRTQIICIMWRRRTSLERYLILICLVISIALLMTIICIFCVKHVNKNRFSNICMSPACTEEAGRIISFMDTSIDPCEDFYNFSCGSFLKTPVPASHEPWLSPSDLSDQYMERLSKAILEAADEEGQPEFVKKVKQFYHSCLNRSQDTTDIIEEILKKTKLNIWPILEKDEALMSSIEESLAIVIIYAIENPFLNIYYLHSTKILKFLCGSPYIKEEVFLNTADEIYVKRKEKYRKLLDYTLYELKISPDAAPTIGQEIIEFETKLANITYNKYLIPLREYGYNETDVTLKEFSSNCKGIKWKYVIRYIYDYYGHLEDFDEEMKIVIDRKEYVDSLCDLFTRTSHREIYNYVVWNLLTEKLIQLHPYFERILREIIYGVVEYVPVARWQACVRTVRDDLFEPGLNYLLIKHLQPEKETEEVKGYVDEIKKAMEHTFSVETWFDSVNRNIAIMKLRGISSNIGYTNFSLDLKLLEKYFSQFNTTDSPLENILLYSELETRLSFFNDSFVFSHHVEMSLPISTMSFYSGEEIGITMGHLVPPHFRFGMPKYLNYGSVGFVIAHKLVEGLDELYVDNSNESSSDTWSKETIEELKRRMQCYLDQYSRFPLGIRADTRIGDWIFADTLADNIGIIEAFKAYENFRQKNGPDPALPGLDFTNEQMFFVKYAQTWCEVVSPENYHRRDPHTPRRYKITGSLQNFPRFSEVYHCPLNSPMNPRHKCQMYE